MTRYLAAAPRLIEDRLAGEEITFSVSFTVTSSTLHQRTAKIPRIKTSPRKSDWLDRFEAFVCCISLFARARFHRTSLNHILEVTMIKIGLELLKIEFSLLDVYISQSRGPNDVHQFLLSGSAANGSRVVYQLFNSLKREQRMPSIPRQIEL